MSQEKTSVPGMENSYYANKKNNMYSRTTTPDMGSRGTMVPGMEEVAPNVGRHESSAKGGAPVVGFCILYPARVSVNIGLFISAQIKSGVPVIVIYV